MQRWEGRRPDWAVQACPSPEALHPSFSLRLHAGLVGAPDGWPQVLGLLPWGRGQRDSARQRHLAVPTARKKRCCIILEKGLWRKELGAEWVGGDSRPGLGQGHTKRKKMEKKAVGYLDS